MTLPPQTEARQSSEPLDADKALLDHSCYPQEAYPPAPGSPFLLRSAASTCIGPSAPTGLSAAPAPSSLHPKLCSRSPPPSPGPHPHWLGNVHSRCRRKGGVRIHMGYRSYIHCAYIYIYSIYIYLLHSYIYCTEL